MEKDLSNETRHKVGAEFEDFIESIESVCVKPSNPQRDEIFRELKKIYSQDKELFRKIAYTLQQGFDYLADDADPFHPIEKIYREAKKTIDACLKKQNDKLLKADPDFFKTYPFRLEPHPYDNPNPPKSNRPPELKNALIKDLSDLLKTQFSEVSERSKFISRILNAFYHNFADPRSIRKHF